MTLSYLESLIETFNDVKLRVVFLRVRRLSFLYQVSEITVGESFTVGAVV